MELKPEQKSYLKAQVLIETLVYSGVKNFCLSPGFRNSTITLFLNNLQKQNSKINIFTHIDERGAAFFALGLAKKNKIPAAIICTSGTALANFHPAVLEAAYSYTPLIVISADRPSELTHVGANQSMNQKHFFAEALRFEAHIEAETTSKHVEYQTAKAYSYSTSETPGPVHLNIAFSDPFLPTLADIIDLPSFTPTVQFEKTRSEFTKESLQKISAIISQAKRPLFVLGPNTLTQSELNSLTQLAEHLSIPLFVEKSSSAPFSCESSLLCSHFDLFLREEKFTQNHTPDLIFRIGPALSSKVFNEWIEKINCPQIILDYPYAGRNPNYTPSIFISGDKQMWFSSLKEKTSIFKRTEWALSLLQKENETALKLTHYLSAQNCFSEWKLHHELVKGLPEKCQIFLGNSMAIRDFDSCAQTLQKDITVFSNRGLSGIDGIISTAIGVALENPTTPTLLLIGDLSAIHDLSSLSLLNRLSKDLPFSLGIMNNHGGEIFRIIKTSEHAEHEKLFTTPQNINFEKIAQAFNLPFERINNVKDFNEFKLSNGPKIFEFAIDESQNTLTRKSFWKQLQN